MITVKNQQGQFPTISPSDVELPPTQPVDLTAVLKASLPHRTMRPWVPAHCDSDGNPVRPEN